MYMYMYVYMCANVSLIMYGCVHMYQSVYVPKLNLVFFYPYRGGEAGFKRAEPFNCWLRLDPHCPRKVECVTETHYTKPRRSQ